MHELDGGVHLVDALARARAGCRERQEADARLPAHHRSRAVGSGNCDGGELFGGRLGVQSAVGEADHAALGALETRRLDQRENARHVDAFLQANDGLRAHEHVARGVGMAAERAVHVAELFHHHGVVHRVLDLAAGALGRNQARRAGRHIALGERVGGSLVGAVDDFHAIERDAGLGGGRLDDFARAHENRRADAVVGHLPGGEQRVGRLAFGHRHALGGALRVLDEFFNQSRHT